MSLAGILVSAGTATTNPDPTTLGTVSPYPTPYVDLRTVSTAWTTQAKPALFPQATVNNSGQVPIPICFVTSSASATYTVNIWFYVKAAATWVQPKDNASFSLTGNKTTFIDLPGDNPIFVQLSSISAGTVAIYFDNGLATAA